MTRLAPKQSTIKRLFSMSGNECAFTDCTNPHVIEGVVVGKIAHIAAAEMDGPRYDVGMTDEERRSFDNLIVLCPTHHDIVDKLPDKYDVAFLMNLKKTHEEKHESNQYSMPEDALDSVVEEMYVVQSNTLYNGTQNNTQNIIAGEKILDFLGKSPQEASESEQASESVASEHEVDESGSLEDINEATQTIPIWVQTIQESSDVISSVGPVMDRAVKEMEESDKQGGSLQGRIKVLNKTAVVLMPIADRIYALGEKFSSELDTIDRGMGSIIDLMSHQEDKSELDGFSEGIRELSSSADYGLGSLDGLLDNMKPLERITKDMKKPIARMKEGLELIRQGKPTINSWLSKIEEGAR